MSKGTDLECGSRGQSFYRDPYFLWGLVGVMFSVVLFLGSLALNYEGDFTRQVRVGKIFYERPGVPELIEPIEPTIEHDAGFDGQFYFYLAHDPFLLNESTFNSFDAPFYRARRIFYPWLIRMVSVSGARILRAIALTQILAIFAVAIAAAGMLRRTGVSPVWVFVITVTMPASVSMEYLTAETIALGLIFLAFWAYLAKRMLLCIVACAAAILAKETNAALVVAIMLFEVMHKRWGRSAAYLSAFVPLIIWVLYLRFRMSEAAVFGTGLINITWPFKGLLQQVFLELGELASGEGGRKNMLRAATLIWFGAGAILLVVAFFRRRSAATIFGLFAAMLVLCLARVCYEFLFHFGRQLYLAPAAIFFVAAEQSGRFERSGEGPQEKRTVLLRLKSPYGIWLLVGFILNMSWHYLRLKGKTI